MEPDEQAGTASPLGTGVAQENGRPGEFRHLGDREVYAGHIWRVVDATFASPDGAEFHRDVVRSPGAVAAIPILFDAEGVASIVMVRQYRAAFGELVLEIPAGMRDVEDEPVEVTAARELVEEVGLEAGDLRPLVQYYPSAGMTDSVLHVFVATDLRPVDRETHGPEEDHSEVVHMPLHDAISRIGTEIKDSKTVIALLLVERQLRISDQFS
jgi:ADP-ribose pyrophosphatase